MISVFLIPKASYIINSTNEISSPLEDLIVVNKVKEYFPKNIIKLVEDNRKIEDVSTFKEKVKVEFMEVMNTSLDKKYAYNNILTEEGKFDKSKLEEAFEEEWKHYCNGVYGICTLNASGSDIAKKRNSCKENY